MEKALEILRNENVFDEEYLCFNNIDIASAIKELEEAMKPKTCELCAYCEPFNSVCFNDESLLCSDFVNSEYGCIYWERKDNA